MRKKKLFKLVLGTAFLCSGFLLWGQEANAEGTYDYVVTDPQFGANGADQDTDSDALAAALAMGGQEQMITIYVPAGTYYLDESYLRILSNTHLILDDNATICRTYTGKNMLRNVDANGACDQTGGYDMSENIIIEGGTWDGGDVAHATIATDVMRFDHAQNVTIRNCTIKNVYDCHLVELIGVKNGTIDQCTFTGFTYAKGKSGNWTYAREAVQLEAAWTNKPSNLKDESQWWARDTVIDGTACDNVSITNCTFRDIPCGVGQHHFSSNDTARNNNIIISNNTITSPTSNKACKTAITCAGMDNVTISNNTIQGPYRFGVHIEEASQVTLDANDISGSSINGIMADSGKKISIVNNGISNIKKHGISIGNGTVTEISGNQISKTKIDGLTIAKGTVTTVSKNTFTDIGRHGISMIGGQVGTEKSASTGFLNNTITSCGQNGICASGGKISAIKGNQIKKVKNNGISMIKKTAVYKILQNRCTSCKNHKIFNGSTGTKTVTKGNK